MITFNLKRAKKYFVWTLLAIIGICIDTFVLRLLFISSFVSLISLFVLFTMFFNPKLYKPILFLYGLGMVFISMGIGAEINKHLQNHALDIRMFAVDYKNKNGIFPDKKTIENNISLEYLNYNFDYIYDDNGDKVVKKPVVLLFKFGLYKQFLDVETGEFSKARRVLN